jgi:hypothetical protein
VQRFATGPVIVVLALFAVYMVYGATRLAITADDYNGAVFWPSIVILYVFAAAAAWAAVRLYGVRRERVSKRSGEPPQPDRQGDEPEKREDTQRSDRDQDPERSPLDNA